MSKLFSRSVLALSLPVAAMTLTPMVAHADDAAVTVTVGATGTLLNRTLVRVPVEISCAPLVVQYEQGHAELRQAVSGRVAFGSGWRESPIICDGAPHANTYLIWVDRPVTRRSAQATPPSRPGHTCVRRPSSARAADRAFRSSGSRCS
jgi:hypothetical protein